MLMKHPPTLYSGALELQEKQTAKEYDIKTVVRAEEFLQVMKVHSTKSINI